jgi:thiol-disulfide isomerase/thioredoxin
MSDPIDTISILFYADWCNPCKRIKPLYEQKIRGTYIMNGISVYEYNYDLEDTKTLMKKFGVKTIPTLCVMNLSRSCKDPTDVTEEDILSIIRMDSHKIETNWADAVLSFSTEEDF